MLSSSNNHMAAASSPTNSLCEGSISPSSAHSHSRPFPHELDSSQHSIRNENSSDDPTDFSSMRGHESLSNLPANIEIHPQNDALSSTSASHQQFIKRPLNAYMIWTRQERRKILTGEPKKKMNEVSKAIQMGERWKKMTDKDKKPYFELARKFANEHKQALQQHPELTYAPSKKKVPKAEREMKRERDAKESVDQSAQSTPCASTPDHSSPRSSTPRQPLPPQPQQSVAQSGQSTAMFMPFQSPFNAGAMQIAQVLSVRTPSTTPGLAPNPYGLPLSASAIVQSSMSAGAPPPNAFMTSAVGGGSHQPPPSFLSPALQHPRFATPQPPLTQSVSGTPSIPATALSRSTPGQVLDLYYSSLCQPAFPTISEPPLHTALYPPQYLLEQYNQHFNNPQDNTNNNSGATPHF